MMVNYNTNDPNQNSNSKTTTNLANNCNEMSLIPVESSSSSGGCGGGGGSSQFGNLSQMNKDERIAYLAQDLLNDLERFNESSPSNNNPSSTGSCNNTMGTTSSRGLLLGDVGMDAIPNYVGMLGGQAESGQMKSSTQSKETKKRSRKRKTPADEQSKPKKKAKSQYQRKNIK